MSQSEKEISGQVNSLQSRLLEVQRNPFQIQRDAVANLGNRQYKYMTLDSILWHVIPVLNAHGLTMTQRLDYGADNHTILITSVHCPETGEVLESKSVVPMQLKPHDFGSWLTYIKRYQIAALLCIADSDDDDAHIAQGQGQEQNHQRDRQYSNSGPPPRNNSRPRNPDAEDSEDCPDCGAPMTVYKSGKPGCSKYCWKRN